MTKKKTEEKVTWSPYGNFFKNTRKAFVIVLYVEVWEKGGTEIHPIVWDSDTSGEGARAFRSVAGAEKYLKNDLLKGGTTHSVVGYEIKQIQLVKGVKSEQHLDD